MELSELKPTERYIDILHPKTDEPLGVKVTLMSLTDERMIKIKRKISDESLRLENRGKYFKAEEIEDNLTDLCIKAMIGWEWTGDAVFNGKKPEFTPAMVRTVFKELPWFRAQIGAAIGDEKSFFHS